MNCTEAQSLILEDLFGELDPKCRREFQEHLQACPVCSMELEQHRDTLDLCASLSLHPAPATARETILQAARDAIDIPKETVQEVDNRPWFRFPVWRVLLPAAGFAAILLAALLTPFTTEDRSSVTLQKENNATVAVSRPAIAETKDEAETETDHYEYPAAIALAETETQSPPAVAANYPAEDSNPFSSVKVTSKAILADKEVPAAKPVAVSELPSSMSKKQEGRFQDTHFGSLQPAGFFEETSRDEIIPVNSSRMPTRSMPLARAKSMKRVDSGMGAPIGPANWSSEGAYGIPERARTRANLHLSEIILTVAEQQAREGFWAQAAEHYYSFLRNFSSSPRAVEAWKSFINCLFEIGEFEAAQRNDERLRKQLPNLAPHVPPYAELLNSFQNE